jgi:hypothetical protein
LACGGPQAKRFFTGSLNQGRKVRGLAAELSVKPRRLRKSRQALVTRTLWFLGNRRVSPLAASQISEAATPIPRRSDAPDLRRQFPGGRMHLICDVNSPVVGCT